MPGIFGVLKKIRGQLKVSHSTGNFSHNLTKINMKWSLRTEFGFQSSPRGYLSALEMCSGKVKLLLSPSDTGWFCWNHGNVRLQLTVPLFLGLFLWDWDYFFASYDLADDAKKSEKNNCNFCTQEPEVGAAEALWQWDIHSMSRSRGENVIFPHCLQNEIANNTKSPPLEFFPVSEWLCPNSELDWVEI